VKGGQGERFTPGEGDWGEGVRFEMTQVVTDPKSRQLETTGLRECATDRVYNFNSIKGHYDNLMAQSFERSAEQSSCFVILYL